MAGAAAKPGARLYFGIPNALVGLAYYPAVAAAFPFGAIPAVRLGLAAAAACAALTSLRLIYELTFVGRDDCASCWTANACNLVLAVAVASLWTH
jgi:uncharacterized membrane protein